MGGRGSFSSSSGLKREGAHRVSHSKGDKILSAGWLGISGNKTSIESSIENFKNRTINENHEFGGYFDSQGFPLVIREGDSGSVSVEASDAIGAAIFVHNHPGNYGGTFSHGDIHGLRSDYKNSNGSVRSVVAIAKEGTYKLSMNNQHSDLDGFIKAFDNAASKKGGLDDKFDSLYNSKGRQAACDVYHNWYKSNAPKYGLSYSRS